MMWHFYEIPYIPDLELVKYQSLGEQGIDGILERHNRFLRQWQRNTVLIHTTLHFFLSYTHERPKGSRLQIFLAFSSDQTVNFESIDALMQASPLADYYKIAPIEDVPVCLRKSFTNILLVKKQEQTRLSTGDTLFTVEGWKSNPKSRLYEMEKTAEALNEDMVYHISIYGSDTYKTAQQALQKPIAILREKALGRSGQITLADNKNRPRDVSAEETLRIYEEFLSDVAKSPCFFANILLYANQKSSAHFLMDTKKKREVIVTNNETGETKAYLIPYGSRIKVVDGQELEAGDELTEGSVNPHDILKIKGVRAVQDYMLREVQRVYRLQGVEINDKHVEVIVRQCLQKIRVEEPGDSDLLPGSMVDALDFLELNEKLEEEGKELAVGSQVLLGITKASLATNSFLSAASFQETTKVLTEAAIKGKALPLSIVGSRPSLHPKYKGEEMSFPPFSILPHCPSI